VHSSPRPETQPDEPKPNQLPGTPGGFLALSYGHGTHARPIDDRRRTPCSLTDVVTTAMTTVMMIQMTTTPASRALLYESRECSALATPRARHQKPERRR
jgi:hypothetical protein